MFQFVIQIFFNDPKESSSPSSVFLSRLGTDSLRSLPRLDRSQRRLSCFCVRDRRPIPSQHVCWKSQKRRLVKEREGAGAGEKKKKGSLSFVSTSGARSSGFVHAVPHRLLCLAHHGRRGWEEAGDKTRRVQKTASLWWKSGSHCSFWIDYNLIF